ncbi:Serine hydroxymethyltransferase 1 [uncultured Pleomorphomonas sp.]|uniref:Probable serine hydroxymethyltransferase n=1 Tax=uncultured Pleomorphomonas sp. TaxID=442121 RepID=A0A212LIR3_9HYPH|nr:serine hydroxymethyltransferase [uncultured Pleomorphomonas sp.]SCM77428.1 Serine hydroxymethyltransferase 1 [uncultured Pleomorphomonas sp.]
MTSLHSIFFEKHLSDTDVEISRLINLEEQRRKAQIELIAPKNYLSVSSREALNSFMSFTSVEGYPGKRYHAGVANIDAIERLAIARAKEMFEAAHANVQPHSGTQANQAAYFALLQPGDVVLSMDLASGGHLSHGLKVNLSGRWFTTISYKTNDSGYIDYAQMGELAEKYHPKLIIVGGSSYPRAINFEEAANIAARVGAYTLADIAHFSGLIVGKQYPSPFPYIDIITTTTNKNLRGPRGGLILTRDEDLGKRIDAAVFPGIQGGPLPEMITAKAVCFGEALTQEFCLYADRVLSNARTMASAFLEAGLDVVTGGTDTPLVVIDLRKTRLTGAQAQAVLEAHGITTNRNIVPNDPQKPNVTSGLRLGTSAISARGVGPEDARSIAQIVARLLHLANDSDVLAETPDRKAIAQVRELSAAFPVYPAKTRADDVHESRRTTGLA